MEKDFTAHIAGLIREMRKAAGMSQMRLAEKLGVSYQQVQKYEKGATRLSVSRLQQLADIFGVPFFAFFEAEAEHAAGLTDDEAKVLMLYRRLKRKGLKDGFTGVLKDIVKLSESEAVTA